MLFKDVSFVLFAAGNSTRMGKCKFLLPLKEEKTIYESIIQKVKHAGIKNVIVVTQQKYLGRLQEIHQKINVDCQFVLNRFPERERFYSLQLAIPLAIRNNFTFIANADNPSCDEKVLKQLFTNRNAAECIVPVHKNKKGHPVLIKRSVLEDMKKVPFSENLKEELRKRKQFYVPVEDSGITLNIDTPEEYTAYLTKLTKYEKVHA